MLERRIAEGDLALYRACIELEPRTLQWDEAALANVNDPADLPPATEGAGGFDPRVPIQGGLRRPGRSLQARLRALRRATSNQFVTVDTPSGVS